MPFCQKEPLSFALKSLGWSKRYVSKTKVADFLQPRGTLVHIWSPAFNIISHTSFEDKKGASSMKRGQEWSPLHYFGSSLSSVFSLREKKYYTVKIKIPMHIILLR